MLKTITAGLLALLAWSVTPAHAAEIGTNKFTDCDESKNAVACTFIYIGGELVKGDGQKFTDLVQRLTVKVDTVLLGSPGGSFEDGMVIAKLVHQRRFATSIRKEWECTSMCAIIWLAGAQRYYSGKSKIGFHSMSTWWETNQGGKKGVRTEAYNAGNALVGAFFYQLGLSDAAIIALTGADYKSMFYLNGKRLEELGIEATREDL